MDETAENAEPDLPSPRVMVVVGRFPDVSTFAAQVNHYLYDNFDLLVAQPLEEEDERDFQGNLRFIGFVGGSDIGGATIDNLAFAISASGGTLGATVYDTMDQAMEDATKRLGFDNGGAALAARAEKVADIVSRFTTITSWETQASAIYGSLMESGRIKMIRGLYDEIPVVVYALITTDEHGENVNINPMAILISSPEVMSKLELPFTNL